MSICNLELGLCCINTTLRNQKPSITCNRTCRLETANNKGLDYIKSLVISNLKDVIKILEWNRDNNIKSYRLSSDMFPHLSNPEFGNLCRTKPRYSIDFAHQYLKDIGTFAYNNNIRLSFHPGQYNQIGAKSKNIFDKTSLDLYCHAMILDIIEQDLDFKKNSAIICIHGGGIYGDKPSTISRWCQQFKLLPENVKNRIAIENCEKCYSSEDCLYISNLTGIPHIFDIHHYNCYNILHPNIYQKPPEVLIPLILNTWKKANKKPYFHISEQGLSNHIGHHSDYVENIPKYMFFDTFCTLDIEAKKKELAILHLLDNYNFT